MADAVFFNPKTDLEVRRNRAMAQKLAEYGKQPTGTEMVSGIAIKRSPLEALAKALSTGAAGYAEGKANELETEDSQKKQKALADAVAMYQSDPQAAANMLMQSPATAEYGLKIGIPALSAGASSVPAPMQVANQMYTLEQQMNNPNISAKDRYAAQRQYNLLGQAAKTYGFDRGMEVGGFTPQPTLAPNPSIQPNSPAQPTLPPAPANLADIQPKPQPEANQLPNGQFNLAGKQDLGYIDMPPPLPPKAPNGAQMSNFIDVKPTTPQVSSIAGYDQAIADREALKAGAAQDAKNASDLAYKPQTEGLKTKATGEAKAITEAQLNLPKVLDNAAFSRRYVQQALDSPGLDANFGAAGLIPNMPGGEASDAKAILDQIEGGAFLTAFETLKGSGQITEVEGEKATTAVLRMKTAQSADAFRKAAKDYFDVIDAGTKRAQDAASGAIFSGNAATPKTDYKSKYGLE